MTARELQKRIDELAAVARKKAEASRGVMRMRWIMTANAIAAIYPLLRELFAGRTANSKWRDE